jgi:transcriptional regulator with XRE-family HTH domain
MSSNHVPRINNLRLHRIKAGYSQKEVTAMLGIKNSSKISRWKNGTFFPNLVNLLKLQILYKATYTEFYPSLTDLVPKELLANPSLLCPRTFQRKEN